MFGQPRRLICWMRCFAGLTSCRASRSISPPYQSVDIRALQHCTPRSRPAHHLNLDLKPHPLHVPRLLTSHVPPHTLDDITRRNNARTHATHHRRYPNENVHIPYRCFSRIPYYPSLPNLLRRYCEYLFLPVRLRYISSFLRLIPSCSPGSKSTYLCIIIPIILYSSICPLNHS